MRLYYAASRIIDFALFTAFGALFLVSHFTTADAQPVRASYYGAEMRGHNADGSRWRPGDLTCAHRTLPLGARLRVVCRGRAAVCRVADHGPASYTRRSLDMSLGMARVLGFVHAGVGIVDVERVD